MTKILSTLLYYLKLILLLVSFAFTFYIVVFMYKRLEKNMMDSISVFLPYIILFTLFSINLIFNQKVVKNNLFYNLVCCFVFILFIYAGYRALFDPYMIAKIRLGYNINFNYYADMISPLQSMLYALSLANVLLMFTKKESKIEKEISEPKESNKRREKLAK